MARMKMSIEINAPIEDVYRRWLDFDRYGEFIPKLISIQRKGDPNVWHWKVRGPKENVLEWDLAMDQVHHGNQVISWHTVRNADIVHSGAITMERLQEGHATRVNIVIDYTQPTGKAENFSPTCDRYVADTVQESLEKLKMLIETQIAQVAGRSKGQ